MKSAKKRVGRPPGRKAPRRPVLSTRVPEEFYEMVKAAAQISGRTISEELVWRARQSFEWESSFGDARKVLADAKATVAAGLPHALREAGYSPLRGLVGTYWIEPGMPAVLPKESLIPEVKAAIIEAVREAVTEALATREDSK